MLSYNLIDVLAIAGGILAVPTILRIMTALIIKELKRPINDPVPKYPPLVIDLDAVGSGFNAFFTGELPRKQKTKEVEPEFPDEFARVINRVMDDPGLREALIEKLQVREEIEKPNG